MKIMASSPIPSWQIDGEKWKQWQILFSWAPQSLPMVTVVAAAKSLQSCPTLFDPIDGSPPDSPVPGILQTRTLEWVAISFSNAWKRKVKVKLLSRVQLLATPWTAAYHQAPPSMGFSRQEYWSGVPLPSLADGDYSYEIKQCLLLGRKAMITKCVKNQRQHFANKGPSSQSYGFSRSYVWLYELELKEGWVLENWYFWIMVLEKTLESPLDCKEIKPVNPKGNQSWIFIGRTDAEAEAPIIWPPNANIRLTRKDPDAGNDWGKEEKGATEDEMVGWHHRLNGHEIEQTLGDSGGQGSLACCSSWGHKESDMTKQLNNKNHCKMMS